MGWGNGVCVECGSPAIGKMMRCLSCNTKAIRARSVAATVVWQANNREKYLATKARYNAAHATERNAYNVTWTAANPGKARARAERYQAKIVRRRLFVPAVAVDVVGRVRALVPPMPGRDDVIQAIMLALLEGTTTLEAVRAPGGIRPFVRRFYVDAFEGQGFAVSLSTPRFDGRSWDDVLTSTEGATL